MSFLAPLALIGAAIIGPIIVAMYMLKLRREDRVVSSTFLWQSMVRDVEANAPWQKLRRNWLLLLQLLILLLLALALARPFLETTGVSGQNLILIIDRSASMGATDGDPSRMEQARQLANRLVGQLDDDGRATVIAAGGQMDVPASATTDRRELREAIDSITLSNGGQSDLAQPLTLASALAARDEQSEIAIISDGNVTIPEDLTVPATVRYFPMGRSDSNVAISAMALQPNAAGQTLFAQATNYGKTAITRRMDVYLDGSLFNAYNLSLEPGQEQSIVAEVPAQVKVAEAILSGEDALPLDDHAWAVSTLGDTITVRVVGSSNRFLDTGLSLLPGVEVTRATSDTTTFEETAAQVPITIFDGVVPSTLPPGNLFFIAPPRSTDFFSVTGEMEFPSVRPAPGDEPLLRNVNLSEVSVLKATRLVPGTWGRIIIDSDGAPLLVVGEWNGRRIAVLTFDLHQSDLPLQVAFPLLLSNLVGFLAPGTGVEAAQIAPGQPLSLAIDPAITEVRLTRPDGTRLSTRESVTEALLPGEEPALRLQNNQLVYADTDTPGVYVVEEFKDNELEARHRYTVNLFAPDESNIAPQPELDIVQESGLQTAVTRERVGKQELWRWLAALALIVLVVEWLVYHKNGLVALRERWRSGRAA